MTSSNTAISVDGRKAMVPAKRRWCQETPQGTTGATATAGPTSAAAARHNASALIVSVETAMFGPCCSWAPTGSSQLDPGHQILRFGRREISQQQWFLGQRAGRVGHHIVSCLRHTARCNARVILSPQAKTLVFAASERDIEPRSCKFVPQDDTIRTDRVGLSRIDLLGAR